ncbi:MAG: trigger factor [Bdellovibrionota bacterium]
MKSTVEHINSVQRRITVTVPVEAVNETFETVFKRLQKKTNIRGFRPGRAPLSIIKKSYAGTVAGEVGELLINNNLFGALKEHEVIPISPPVVETEALPAAENAYEFSAVIDVMPVIELKNYKNLSVSVKEYTIGESSVDRELKALARRAAKASPIEGNPEVSEGQLITLTHTASSDGQDIPELSVEKIPVAIGQKEIFPELEKELLGLQKGQSKDIEITLPKDYQREDLAGKTIQFAATIDDIAKLDIPQLDDEFAKDMNVETLEELKKNIESHLKETAQRMHQQELENALLTAVRNHNEFEVPPAVVEQVTDDLIKNMGISDKATLDKILADENFRKNFRDEAKQKAKNTILLWEVAKAEGVEINDEDIKEHIKSAFGEQNAPKSKEIEDIFKKAGEKIRENLKLEKALDALKNSATIANIPVEI